MIPSLMQLKTWLRHHPGTSDYQTNSNTGSVSNGI